MFSALARGLQRLVAALHWLEDALLAGLLGGLLLLASVQILLRNAFDAGLPWADPLLRILVLWVGLLGAMAASRDERHITVDVVSQVLPPRGLSLARALTSLFTAGVAAVVALHAGRFVATELEAGASGLARLPAWPFELILPVAFGVIALRALIACARHARALSDSGAP